MKKLIKELKEKLEEVTELCEELESQGSLNYEDTENYGVYLGKKELLEDLIPQLEKLNKK